MFTNLTPTNLIFIGLIAIFLYVVIVGIAFNKRILSLVGKPITKSPEYLSTKQVNTAALHLQHDLLPPLLDKPADHPMEQAGVFDEEEEEEWEMLDYEPITLLKEAEKVVEQIQDVVDHIASYPPSPEEVTSKIHAVVSQYSLFMDTEYYDAINTFIAVTVERDCDLKLTVDDIQALWYAEAA